MKHFFIPTEKNNHTPHLLHVNAFIVYILIIFSFNFIITNLGLVQVSASFEIEELLQAHNQKRNQSGLTTLTIDEKLNQSANDKARAMLRENCWSHYCPEGVDWTTYFVDNGYEYIHAGENLAEGFSSIDAVMNAWMNSPTHKANIMNQSFNEVGFGIINGDFQGNQNNTIIVVHFGYESNETAGYILASDDISDDRTLRITSPQDGERTNNALPKIEGNVTIENAPITISANSEEIGNVEAQGSNYAYKPNIPFQEGKYVLQTSTVNNLLSNVVTLFIDITPPYIVPDSLKVQAIADDQFKISFEVSEPINAATVNIAGSVSLQPQRTTCLLEIPEIVLNNEFLIVNIEDLAGNSNQEKISTEFILSRILDGDSQHDENPTIMASFVSQIQSKGIKTLAVICFIMYLLCLLVLDFVFLHRNDKLSIPRSKSHVHLSTIIVFLLLITVGSTTGSIL